MVTSSKKRGIRLKLYLLILVSCSCFLGCIGTDFNDCTVEYNLYIRAEDNSGNDISTDSDLTDGYLYLFNNYNEFEEKHYISHRAISMHEPIQLTICPNKSYKVVAWVNSSIGKMIDFNPASLLAVNKVFFLPEGEEYKFIQSDIFQGNNRIPLYDADSGVYSDELIVRRRLSAIHVSVKGINPDHNPEDYRVEIHGGFYRAFNFESKPCEPTIHINKYKSNTEWAAYNNLLVMPKALKVAPLEPNEPFEVQLFYQDKLIRQFNKDHIGHPICPQAGERMNILIDMRQQLGDFDGEDNDPQDANLTVLVRVNNWNSIELWEEW